MAGGVWRLARSIAVALVLAVTSASCGSPSRLGTFEQVGSMKVARIFHTATLLQDGRVLIAGGETTGEAQGSKEAVVSAELYDPNTAAFALTGAMNAPRASHTATLLEDGRVLIAGGSEDGSAELYDPATGLFVSTGSLVTPRSSAEARRLPGGKVLILGGTAWSGQDYAVLASAELYDPATGTFSLTGSMTVGRIGMAVALLRDGRVLVAGGRNDENTDLASAEVYDPARGDSSRRVR